MYTKLPDLTELGSRRKTLVSLPRQFQVDADLCSPKPCSIGPFYQPSIPADLSLFATGVYHKTMQAFVMLKGHGDVISPAQLHMAAQNYCRKV